MVPFIIIMTSFVKQWGETAICKASAKGHTETVKVLLQAKADTEIPLHADTYMHTSQIIH